VTAEQARVDELVEARQALRGRDAGAAELEANRLQLVAAVRDVGAAALAMHFHAVPGPA
jgi:hypothetical protein